MRAAGLARTRPVSSQTRHGESGFRTFGLDAGPLVFAPPHVAGWSYLVTLRAGAATVRCGNALAFASPERAVWVPRDERFALDLRGACRVRIAYLRDEFAGARAFGSVVLSPLLGEAIERSIAAGYLDPAVPRDARLLAVARDEIAALASAAAEVALVLPQERALASAAERALAARDEPLGIAALAATAGMSVRTFERRFARETGLAPREWLRRARLSGSALALAGGTSVTDAALGAGYASVSAYIAAYRSVFGVTPGRAPARDAARAPRRRE